MERSIDRENNCYFERVTNRIGEVIRLCEEPLTEHKQHNRK